MKKILFTLAFFGLAYNVKAQETHPALQKGNWLVETTYLHSVSIDKVMGKPLDY